MTFFPMFPSVKETLNDNQTLWCSLYLHLSGSVFLVSFKDSNNQLFNVQSVLKFLRHGLSVKNI